MNTFDEDSTQTSDISEFDIAVIGMSGRFPGASSIQTFWDNLTGSVESIRPLNDQELSQQGVDKALQEHPNYVKVGSPLEQADHFDAGFFGFSPAEAEVLDPQQRVFLECAWSALESAGYDSEQYSGHIGVYGAAAMSSYLMNLYSNTKIRERVSPYELFVANDKDFLATRAGYKLNLTGPCVTVQTACSSSLVAVHMACQSLIGGECDMAIAGGVAVTRQQGYLVQEGSILSADGHCRSFDAKACGTVPGNGIGLVVLKRLEDSIADGDTIDAVIKGSAINNDGANKVSFTAPQVDSQADVIQSALQMADVSAETIQYVEAHGTATSMGDPIEVAALRKAFGDTDKAYCALGSVKSNIGHLDTAAGIAGLIKTILAIKHGQIPATLHYQTPNPHIDFEHSPFFVNDTLKDWPEANQPRRASVSSFGIGGTNAHMVVEQAPSQPSTAPSQSEQLLVISAKSSTALQQQAQQLADYLEQAPHVALDDMAFTLQQGRRAHTYREAIVAIDQASAIEQLRQVAKHSEHRAIAKETSPTLIFQFPGQGSQYAGMTQSLYQHNDVFREQLTLCTTQLDSLMDCDSLALLFEDEKNLHQTQFTQPLLFAVEYALAKVWLSLGLNPQALHGHSVGEYVAACLAGVFDLTSALRLVVARGQLMQAAEPGAMLTVFRAAEELTPWLNNGITLAASNAPQVSVVSGPTEAIEALRETLKSERIFCKAITTSHAFHSPMMAKAADEFEQFAARMTFNPPRIPMISNLTGNWLSDEQACSPAYWSAHLLNPVRYSEGVQTLLDLSDPSFLEVGPQQALTTLANQQLDPKHKAIASLANHNADSAHQDTADLLKAVGQLWCRGFSINTTALHSQPRRRIPLPTYPFERQRFWVEPCAQPAATSSPQATTIEQESIAQLATPAEWVHRPSWQRSQLTNLQKPASERHRWLIFDDQQGLGEALFSRFEHIGEEAQLVVEGDHFDQVGYRRFSINPKQDDDYAALLEVIKDRAFMVSHVVFLWPLKAAGDSAAYASAQQLQRLLKALAALNEPVHIQVVTHQAYDVIGSEAINPNQALLQGLCQVAYQEYPLLACRQIDLVLNDWDNASLAQSLSQEGHAETPEAVIALRGKHRWQRHFEQSPLAENSQSNGLVKLKKGGHYVILGDLDQGLGKVWGEQLATHYQANLILIHSQQQDHTALPETSLQRWRDLGATVTQWGVNTTEHASIKAIVDQVSIDHGNIDGVFFSTPMTNLHSAAPIELLTEQQWHYNQQAKLDTLEAMHQAFAEQAPRFFCIQSSLSAIVGGLGLAAYSGANQAIDSFVAKRVLEGQAPWFVMNWDACSDALPSEDPSTEAQGSGWGSANLNPFTLSGDEVWCITERILQQGQTGQSVISRADLKARIAQWISTTPKVNSDTVTEGSRHARPALDTPFIAPRNEVEATVAEILQDLLGIEAIGVQDSFYDLGGQSLLAIQAIARLRDAFPVDVEMRELLFESPTAERIAAVISEQLPDQEEMDQMAALLAEVQQETLTEH